MNVLMTGVGGQGIILASDILSEVMMRAGRDVKKSEIHGMAQRGGSVMSHVRFADKVFSPIIPYGKCDILVSFEELETARYLPYLNGGSQVIINKFRLSPPSVISGKDAYPDILPLVENVTKKIDVVEGSRTAKEIGNQRGVNIVLMGVLSKFLDVPESLWIETLNDMIAEKIRKINIEGFLKGRELSK
jgi:indolepyruvate ferredoxin oxidoreductase beta subunit